MNLFLRQITFFVVIILVFIGGVYVVNTRNNISLFQNMKDRNVVLAIAIVFALIITLAMTSINVCDGDSQDNYEHSSGSYNDYAELGGVGDSNIMFDNQAALCRGGRYMYQGNSPIAKMCQSLSKTEQGQEMINQYNCDRGFIGMPKNRFEYTSNSNSCYEGIKCDGKEPLPDQ